MSAFGSEALFVSAVEHIALSASILCNSKKWTRCLRGESASVHADLINIPRNFIMFLTLLAFNSRGPCFPTSSNEVGTLVIIDFQLLASDVKYF